MKPNAKSVRRIGNVQAMRGIAALLVVVMHALNIPGAFSGNAAMAAVARAWRPFGHSGVDVFFVISGFIMFVVSRRGLEDDRGTVTAACHFLQRRVVRIYPLFWITLVALLLIPPLPGTDTDWHVLLKNPGWLVLAGMPSVHPVAWTLVFEMHFYVIVAVIMLFGRRWLFSAFGAWALLQICAVILGTGGVIGPYVFLNQISLEFVLGVALGAVISAGIVAHPVLLILIGVAAWLAAGVFLPEMSLLATPILRVVFFAMPAAAVLYGLIILEADRAFSLPARLENLGDASYSLYLWHLPVLFLLSAIWSKSGLMTNPLGSVAFVAIGIGASLLVGRISFRLIESRLVGRAPSLRSA